MRDGQVVEDRRKGGGRKGELGEKGEEMERNETNLVEQGLLLKSTGRSEARPIQE